MKKCFVYERLTIFMGYGSVLLFLFAAGLWLLLIGPAPRNNDEFLVALPSFILLGFFALALVAWIIVMLKTRICVDDNGISYYSPLKQVVISWSEITTINHKYISGFSPGKYGGPPQDLLIKTTGNKTLKIYAFLKIAEEDEGLDENRIQDFEAEIKKYAQGIKIG